MPDNWGQSSKFVVTKQQIDLPQFRHNDKKSINTS